MSDRAEAVFDLVDLKAERAELLARLERLEKEEDKGGVELLDGEDIAGLLNRLGPTIVGTVGWKRVVARNALEHVEARILRLGANLVTA